MLGWRNLQEVGVGKASVRSVHEKDPALEISQRLTLQTEEMAHGKFQNEAKEEGLAHPP